MSFTLRIPKNTRSAVLAKKPSATVTTSGVLYRLAADGTGLEPAIANTTVQQKLYIVDETLAAADARITAHAIEVNLGDKIVASTVNNSDAAHSGQAMILNASGTALNNTGTTSASGVFVQLNVIGAAADKLVLAEKIS